MQTKDFQAAKRKVPGPIMALIRTAGPFSYRDYPRKRKMASFRLGTTRPGLCREQAGSERESEEEWIGHQSIVEKVRLRHRSNFFRRADALVRELRGGPRHQPVLQCGGFTGSLLGGGLATSGVYAYRARFRMHPLFEFFDN